VPAPRYPYASYARLAGPLETAGDRHQVEYVPLGSRRRGRLLAAAAVVLEVTFLVWLLWPSHYPEDTGDLPYYLSMTMVASVAIIECLRLLNIATLGLATISARDPKPVHPQPGLRIAFVTTLVPGKEPLAMVEQTLRGAKRVRHDGEMDVWLLDEGNDPGAIALCRELGVRHFSRKGVERWNQPSGTYKAKTKHGNYNSWLERWGHGYDVMLSVDTDHVPVPEFAERMLGYFRDPDVAFVVGPQVYGNYDNVITKAAESQQYLFHSVLQRAANRSGCAMFVGTNNAVRIEALLQIGGLADSITEDAATSLHWHAATNPATGNPWSSVYTPDVLAVGEGPTSWSDYFNQQYRWARGTDEVLVRQFARTGKLGWRRRLHYSLLMSYYPSAAISWTLGALNISLYLVTGIGGVKVAAETWFALYLNAAVLQLGIYFWNRRHNVSPHEQEGSSGVLGMFISVLTAPIYLKALIDTLLGKASSFTVTAKGAAASADGWGTFSLHLKWTLWFSVTLGAALIAGNAHDTMLVWAVLALVVSALPILMWRALPDAPQPEYGNPTHVLDVIELPADAPAVAASPALTSTLSTTSEASS
jgi:cellulose synthase/poly-beta-1,6-N-acetylglucosamine synthase-like glycosyltransferase